MDYPNNFDTPTFPAGKSIALSRQFSIWTLIVFFLIFCACGFVVLGIHLKKNYPFLISINPFTNDWTVVAYPGKRAKEKVEQYQIIQETLARNFVTDWFTISPKMATNDDRWQECSVDECGADEQYNPENKTCTLSCRTTQAIFDEFNTKVLPEYNARIAEKSERWTVTNVTLVPHSITQSGSTWQIYTTINSNINGDFEVLVFMKILNTKDKYPATLGYYVDTFNAYRITR